MKRWFLALAALLTAAVGMASADYIVITANVGHSNSAAPPMGNQMGGPGPGMLGVPPGGGVIGAPPAGSTGQMGVGPGPMGPMPAGSAGQMGALPGGLPFPGGAQMGGQPGFNQQGGPPQGQAIMVGAVVEVDAAFKDLVKHALIEPRLPIPAPLLAHDRWGAVRLQNYQGAPLDLRFVPLPGEQVPTVAKRIEAKFKEVFADKSGQKPSAEKVLDLAEYVLTHDRNDKFVEVMKKLGEDNPTNNIFVAFQKVQADLDRPVTKDETDAWQKRLGGGYKTATAKDGKGHYVVFHNLPSSDQDEVQERLGRLEDSLRTFYYWFVLKSPDHVPPIPDTRQTALLTAKEPEFQHTRDSLTDPPIVADAFFARRETLSVFCARPLDPYYDMLDKTADPILRAGNFVRQDLLSGKDNAGYPKGTPAPQLAYAGTLSLLMKALEDESERAGVSHDVSRQLLFASGLLPRGVVVPEWVQFGMGSFFETPEHSPWPTPAGPSALYLPMYRQEMKGKKFEGDAAKTLRKIVTDGYFRELTPDDVKNRSAAQMRARTAAWSLTYFLAQKKLDNLQRYFKALSEMPRDLELDDDALWECFARSFDAFDLKTKHFDNAKLDALAGAWQSFVWNEHLESEDLVKELEKTLSDLKDQTDKPPAP